MSRLCLELINLGKLVERGMVPASTPTPGPIPCADLGEGSVRADQQSQACLVSGDTQGQRIDDAPCEQGTPEPGIQILQGHG